MVNRLDAVTRVVSEAENTDKFKCVCVCLCVHFLFLSEGVPQFSSPYSQSKEAIHSS